MAGKTRNYSTLILNLLMRYDRPLSTKEVCDLVGCERKTVYAAMDTLEVSGFGIEIGAIGPVNCKQNTYKFIGLHGPCEV